MHRCIGACFIADIPIVVEELFSLSKNLPITNVACYKAAAILLMEKMHI